MLQTDMIEKVRLTASRDEAVSAVLMYGSFAKEEGDRYSDIEFYIFTRSDVDRLGWVSRIAPVAMFFTNEFGTDVAVFDNLVRGEFHFADVANIGMVKTWQGLTSFERRDRMNLVDKDGLLTEVLSSIEPPLTPVRDTAENIEWLAQSLLNNLLFTKNLILRGELAHAYQNFWFVHRYLLWLIRIRVGSTAHWETPAKGAEKDIPAEWYARYRACLPCLHGGDLRDCYDNSTALAAELFGSLEVPASNISLLGRISGWD